MSEQEQAPVEGTPENAAPVDETTGTPTEQQQQVDWEKRYNDMRSEFDRRGSRVSELEPLQQAVADLQSSDPDTRNRAAQALGLPFEFVDDTPEDDDDTTPFLTREEWREYQQQQAQERAQSQAQAAEQQQVAQIEQHIETHKGLNALDESDRDWVIARALSIPPKMSPEGVPLPDVDTALEQFTGWDKGRFEKWRTSKRAPHISQVGTAGTQALPLDAGHAERVAAAMERLNADQ